MRTSVLEPVRVGESGYGCDKYLLSGSQGRGEGECPKEVAWPDRCGGGRQQLAMEELCAIPDTIDYFATDYYYCLITCY